MSPSRFAFAKVLLWLGLVGFLSLASSAALAQRATISPPFGSTLPQATAYVSYSTSFTGSGGLEPYEFTNQGGMPPGLTLALRGALTGTPTTPGTYTITVGFMDANGRDTSGTYSLTVLAPSITLSPASLPDADAGASYGATISASGGTGPYTFSLASGTLPAGLSLDDSGQVSGTVTAAGDASFTILATDQHGFTGQQAYTIAVAAPTISLSPASLPNATAGTSYVAAITATGGTAPYTFSLASGALPAGLALRESGVLAGILLGAGSASFTVLATDQYGFTGQRTYSIGVVIDPGQVAARFESVASNFVELRQRLIAGTIQLPGLHDRRGGTGLSGGGTGDSNVLNFAASLADLRGEADAAARALGATVPPLPFNIWVDGHAGWHNGGDAPSGSFGIVGVGADYLVNDALLLGAAVYGDWADAGDTSGKGVLAGPYASIGLTDSVTLDLSLLHGGSSNDISSELFGTTYAGSFDTTRWLAHARLEAEWQFDALTVRPRAELSYSSETASDYTVRSTGGDEVAVDGFTSSELAAGLGTELEYAFAFDDGLSLTPKLGFEVGLEGDAPYGGITGGVELAGGDSWDVTGTLRAGFDAGGLASVAVQGGLSARF